MFRSSRLLHRSLAALARLVRGGRNGQPGEAPGVPRRSSRHPPPPPSGKSPTELARIGRQVTQLRMHKIIGEWRATTDPVEKRFLHDLLESMRVDLAAAAAEVAALDAPDLGVPGSGEE